MIKKLRWVAIRRVPRAATLGFALALVAAPAAYGADGNPWHINVHGAQPTRTNTVKATAYPADGNPWHINIHSAKSARMSAVKATAYTADGNPWHINIHSAKSARMSAVKATAYRADGNPWHINIHGDTASLSTAAAATTAAAGAPVSVDVSGTQTVIDEAAGTSAMQGSLVGTWYTTKFVPRYASSSQFVASGKELFVGCLDSNANGSCDTKEPAGELKFTFMFWASFDPATGALLHGNCVHPITGGSGSFRKAAGVIFMEDTPTGDTVVTTYKGTVEYQAATSGQAAKHRTPASAGAPAAGHGGVCGGS